YRLITATYPCNTTVASHRSAGSGKVPCGGNLSRVAPFVRGERERRRAPAREPYGDPLQRGKMKGALIIQTVRVNEPEPGDKRIADIH
ncbi:unnamed protein product, partial [Heterotrigona itama]